MTDSTTDLASVLAKAFHEDATFGHSTMAENCFACRDIQKAVEPVIAARVAHWRSAYQNEGVERDEAVEALDRVMEEVDRLDDAWARSLVVSPPPGRSHEWAVALRRARHGYPPHQRSRDDITKGDD